MNSLILYDKIKDSLKTGDMIQFRTDSIIGELIRLKTHDDRPNYEKENRINVNHTALVIRLKEYEGLERRTFILESLGYGFCLSLLPKVLLEHNGEAWFYPLREEWNIKREEIGETAFKYLGTKYDYESLFKFLIGKVSTNARRFFCSEAYYYILGGRGNAPSPNFLPGIGWHEKPIKIL